MSRPAISKHIKILTQCGLVVIEQKGRERYYRAQPGQLQEVSQWIEQYRVFWQGKFDALDQFLSQEAPPEEVFLLTANEGQPYQNRIADPIR
jgi:DNA-binding transcriptional ArsR family regulator